MHQNDNDFFEAYKKLEKVCSDLYSAKNGVSEYISDMETKATFGHRLIPSWDSDYKGLKHIRWVRNRIAHDTDNAQISEPSDLAFAKDFRGRILYEKDPLTLLRKAGVKETRVQTDRQSYSASSQPARYSQSSVRQSKRKNKPLPSWVVLILFLLLIALYFIFSKNLR